MPPGKQAAPGIFSVLIRNGCGKMQDAPPNPFSVFFPSALSIGSAIINTTPTFCERGGSFCVSHSLRDWGEEQDHPSEKMRRCITGEPSLATGKISRAFQIVPPSLRAVWKSPWGLAFLCNPGFKTLLPPFLPGGNFCVSHSQRDWGRTGPPLYKNTPVHNGRVGPCRGKIFRAFQIVPPSLRAVWESPWGLNFHEIRNIKHCSHFFSLRRGRE